MAQAPPSPPQRSMDIIDRAIAKVRADIDDIAVRLRKSTKGNDTDRAIAALSSISRSPSYCDGVHAVLRLIVGRTKGEAAPEALEAFDELLKNPRFDRRLFPAVASIAESQKQGTVGTCLYIVNEMIKNPDFSLQEDANLLGRLSRAHPLKAFLLAYKESPDRPRSQAILKSGFRNYFLWLGRELDRLHSDPGKRARLLKKIPRPISYFILGEASEVYTSSFNLLFKRLGKGNPLGGIWKLDPNNLYLPGFLLKASYFGRFPSLMPDSTAMQRKLVDDLFNVAQLSDEAKYFVADVFSYIFSLKERRHFGLQVYLQQSILATKGRFADALFITLYRSFGPKATGRYAAEHEALCKRYGLGPAWHLRRTPSTWKAPQQGEEGPAIRIKLYFHKEWHYDNHAMPLHRLLFEDFLQKKGFSRRYSDGSAGGESQGDVILTGNAHGTDIVFILSIAKNLDLENDMKDPSIDVIGHRGHSYQALETFGATSIRPRGKMLFLGSCGGYSSIPELYRRFGPLPILATKNIGVGVNNNALLYHLALIFAKGERRWEVIRKTSLWKAAAEKGVDRKLLGYYVFPGNQMEVIHRILNHGDGSSRGE